MLFHSNLRQRRRAVAAVHVVVALPVLVGFTAITVDLGAVYNARTDLQRTADAAALAAITEFAYGDGNVNGTSGPTDLATRIVGLNPVMGHDVSIVASDDVAFGRAYYNQVANSYNFVAGDVPTNAVRVAVRHTEDSPNGQLPLYFAGLLGESMTNVSAEAVAMYAETSYEQADCYHTVPNGKIMLCHYGDSDDSDDSEGGYSDDSDDSSPGDSDGAHAGDPDDSDDSSAGDSDDSDDSNDSGDSADSAVDSGDSDSGGSGDSDSEGYAGLGDSDGPRTILADSGATPFFIRRGDTIGPCDCPAGDSDDSDDSELGDSADSDDSDTGDSDGSTNGDSDDSDDSEGGHSDDSDDSTVNGSDNGNNGSGKGNKKITICHIPPGNPANAHTITVGKPAVFNAHIKHGDLIGPCLSDRELRFFLIE